MTLADYIADHYGACRLKDCLCNRNHRWIGRMCEHWQPVPARTWDQLTALFRNMKGTTCDQTK